jgi:hypothetical protein
VRGGANTCVLEQRVARENIESGLKSTNVSNALTNNLMGNQILLYGRDNKILAAAKIIVSMHRNHAIVKCCPMLEQGP